ncbi:MAG: SDR family oxidoreductase [Chloroflexi bacterium]|nr:SDR family oxidoreductase [Chloroflexota bacterium]
MPRPLNEQVVVITGASSGIGREAALMFGQAGAAVVLVARNEEALHDVAHEITRTSGRALIAPADVSEWEQVQIVARTAVDVFGRIDTWVNNAGISLYATVDDTTVEEAQRIIETNFLGVVHGVSAALPYMKREGQGTIINVGSVESQRALPLQAVYAASKHAVKGYTEALRMEQQAAASGIRVTLILPSGINTPLFNHARSKIGLKPMPVPPVYTPELVARSIVRAAASPQRTIYVGGAGHFLWMLQRLNPALLDQIMVANKSMFRMQTTDEPDNGMDNLYQPMPGRGRVHGDFDSLTKPSIFTPLIELSPQWLRQIFAMTIPASLVMGAIYGILRFVKR